MRDLFNTEENRKVVERINKLSSESKAVWGKMGPAEMLYHCSQAMESAFGSLKLKRSFMGMLFGSMAKKQMLGEKPFKQGLPTDSNFKAKDTKNFGEEKSRLIKLVEKFAASGESGLSTEPHPFFGRMTSDEWNKLMSKHLDHHLRQFGV